MVCVETGIRQPPHAARFACFRDAQEGAGHFCTSVIAAALVAAGVGRAGCPLASQLLSRVPVRFASSTGGLPDPPPNGAQPGAFNFNVEFNWTGTGREQRGHAGGQVARAERTCRGSRWQGQRGMIAHAGHRQGRRTAPHGRGGTRGGEGRRGEAFRSCGWQGRDGGGSWPAWHRGMPGGHNSEGGTV